MAKSEQIESKQLDKIATLLQQILVVELAKAEASQEIIARKLGIAKQTVNRFLRGLDFNK